MEAFSDLISTMVYALGFSTQVSPGVHFAGTLSADLWSCSETLPDLLLCVSFMAE